MSNLLQPLVDILKFNTVNLTNGIADFTHDSDEEALAETPRTFPMQEKTVRGGIASLTWHDSYHLGQVWVNTNSPAANPYQRAILQLRYSTMKCAEQS